MNAPSRALSGDALLVLASAAHVYELEGTSAQDAYIQDHLGLSAAAYWNVLHDVLDDPSATHHAPATITTLRERHSRQMQPTPLMTEPTRRPARSWRRPPGRSDPDAVRSVSQHVVEGSVQGPAGRREPPNSRDGAPGGRCS
ncbi:DUF3263 domain-containing protein [Streptomyces sp. NPDC051644]|uniref:DUF3263 domain-containing protein n=1 Tax=Streptomyces sp. NPDC051644 TaxID=3365666 RepID=UPI003792112D